MLTFVSYSRKDMIFSSRLRSDLLQQNIPVWRDLEDIRLGVHWDKAISDVLSSGEVSHFLLILSEAASNSENVLNEIEYARRVGIPIIPLVIEDCKIPLNVVRCNHVNFQNDYQEAFQKLLAELNRIYPERNVSNKRSLGFVKPPALKHPTQQQLLAAHDTSQQVRLIAGPGTGKSFVIEERVRELLNVDVNPNSIFVVSFTRASSRDLKRRIIKYCEQRQVSNSDEVSVTTLHSLALRILRKAKLLTSYPADPLLLDKWETEEFFDEEFSEELGYTPSRCEEIRKAYEAYWCTGDLSPSNYILPKVPITKKEKEDYIALYIAATKTYSCVLPGEIIRKCVEQIETGLLHPLQLLGIRHLIVDEFQDLNQTDLSLINSLAEGGVFTFVAGDDDQSIYSFRYAFPSGIQDFTTTYPRTGQHELQLCFRSTPTILRTALSFIASHPSPKRIKKVLKSRYEDTFPRVDGVVYRWQFRSEVREANAIASSSQQLIERGIAPHDILILISNRGAQLSPLQDAFGKLGIGLELPSGVRYIDTTPGRFAYAMMRVACDLSLQDYVAHRLLLGLPKGIGKATCNNIRTKVISYNLNYLDLFYNPLPNGIFTALEFKAINRARGLCSQIKDWHPEDTLAQRSRDVIEFLEQAFKAENLETNWNDYVAHLPEEMTLKECVEYMGTDIWEQQITILTDVYLRLNLEPPKDGLFAPKVRVMTMHGCKGLDAQVVFIPGLEEDIFPGTKRKKYTGLVQEAARLLYVSISRSRAACILSFSTARKMMGQFQPTKPSQFNINLQGRFIQREDGLSDSEAHHIVAIVDEINRIG